MNAHGSAIVFGILGAVVGGACMTAMRLVGHRAGMIDRTVPQAAEEWLAARVDLPSRGPALHHALDHALHYGYSAMWGAAYGFAVSPYRRSLVSGPAFGLGVWALGRFVLLPLLKVARGPSRATVGEIVLDGAAHAVFGAVTALTLEELARQPGHGASSDATRAAARVG